MNKNKLLMAASILLGCVFFLIVVARITGALAFHSLPTPSNEPSIKQGSTFYTSNLKKYKRLDFICYEHHETNEIYIFRLCGLPGDKVELKNGVLYINDQNVDQNLTLMHNYAITQMVYDSLRPLGLASASFPESNNSDLVYTSVVDSAAYNCEGTNFDYGDFLAADYPMIKEAYQEDWTPNDFGPIKVPADSVFVLGDSRDNSFDSRYSGFVAESAIVSTKL